MSQPPRGLTFPDPQEVFEANMTALDAERAAWADGIVAGTGIPPRMAEYTLASFPAKGLDYYSAVLRYVTDQTAAFPRLSGLIILGPAGTGKTGLATSAFRRLIEEFGRYYGTPSYERSGWWISQEDLLDCLRADSGALETDSLTRAQTTGLLYIDDLVSSRGITAWAFEQIFKVIDARYKACLPIIATANLSAFDDLDDIDRRLSGRLREICYIVEIPADGQDLRRR